MAKKTTELALHDEIITSKIHLIRGQGVMLDSDLAELYRVETGQLKRQVRRNIDRFPSDFMFELTAKEMEDLRSQIGISSWGGVRYAPMVFTELGVAMLSSVLNSKISIDVNIQIMRVFTRMRQLALTHKDILLKLEQIEKNLIEHGVHLKKHDEEIQLIFKYLKQLLNPPQPPRKKIGYNHTDD